MNILITGGAGFIGSHLAEALHELGHGFGLWGHSDRPDDVMTAVPGPRPPSDLSPRDRETLRWLLGRPSLFRPEPPPPTP